MQVFHVQFQVFQQKNFKLDFLPKEIRYSNKYKIGQQKRRKHDYSNVLYNHLHNFLDFVFLIGCIKKLWAHAKHDLLPSRSEQCSILFLLAHPLYIPWNNKAAKKRKESERSERDKEGAEDKSRRTVYERRIGPEGPILIIFSLILPHRITHID